MLTRLTLALPGAARRRDASQDAPRRPAGLAARADAGDAELMAWAGAGDRAAFDILVERHAERVLRLALRVLGDAAEAEDVAQDAFLRAWQAAPRFDPGRARFTTWLHRIVLNLAIDHARRRGRLPPAGLDAAKDLPDPAKGPEARLSEAEGREALVAALDALPPRQRAAIALAYEEGLSGAAAAEALSVSERALEGLLRRARQMLRARLDPGGKR
ncbi:MAG: RNA polymerase sigma factor [Acetobacteraceae bacterium]|nr:RNA polymerase sigma factor [Acetobacteraceae bacterium]